MSITIRLGSITFNGPPDADGDRFIVSSIDGWEYPDVDFESNSRHPDGEVLARIRLKSRPVTLEGFGIAPTTSGVWRVRDKLTQASNWIGADGVLYVDEPYVPKKINVRTHQPAKFRKSGPYGVEFSIDLISLDPYKYPQAGGGGVMAGGTFSAGSFTIDYTGGAAIAPTLIFSPGGTERSITSATDANRSLRLSGPIPTHTTVVVDMRQRIVRTAEGANMLHLLDPSSQWWELIPGPNELTYNGPGTVTVSYQEVWL